MDIKDIANLIKSRKTAVFCGAGISRQSGIPLVNEIVREILKRLDVDADLINRYIAEKIPFEMTMEVLLSNSQNNNILSLFESNNPQRNHVMLAMLAKRGILSHIITTNFDTCIEQALDALRANYLKISDQEKQGLPDNKSDLSPCLLIKLHGCISRKSQLCTTIRSVANQRGIELREAMIKNALQGDLISSLLVIGYSFSDLFDINQIFIRNRFPIKIIIIQHETGTIPRTLPFSDIRPDHPLKSYDGTMIICDTDAFIEELWPHLIDKTVPSLIISDSHIQTKIDFWITEIEKIHGTAMRHLLASLIFKTANMYSISNEYAKKAISFMEIHDYPFEACTALQTIGDNYRDLQNTTLAQKYLQQTLRIASHYGLQLCKARAINSLKPLKNPLFSAPIVL